MEAAGSGEHKNNPDSLYLKGRLQMATARDALMRTGANPKAVERLVTFLGVHADLSSNADQNDLVMFLQGGDIEKMKKDIIESLKSEAGNNNVPEDKREAFRALHELLTEE